MNLTCPRCGTQIELIRENLSICKPEFPNYLDDLLAQIECWNCSWQEVFLATNLTEDEDEDDEPVTPSSPRA